MSNTRFILTLVRLFMFYLHFDHFKPAVLGISASIYRLFEQPDVFKRILFTSSQSDERASDVNDFLLLEGSEQMIVCVCVWKDAWIELDIFWHIGFWGVKSRSSSFVNVRNH